MVFLYQYFFIEKEIFKMKCKNCGANVREGSAFCGRCGAPVPRPAPQPVKKYEYSGAVPKQKKNTGLIVAIILLAALIAAAAIIVCAAMYNRDDSGTNASETSTQAVVPTAEPVYVSPVFPTISASDETRATSSKRNYSPSLAADGDPSTAWNVSGGVGEWIKLSADSVQTVKGIKILNGYTKYSPDYNMWLYYANRRAKDITVSFSDGSEMKFTLQDIFDQHSYYYQPIDFGTVKYTTYIKIRIDSIYPGSKWDDMCFSEIVPY